MRSSLTRRGAAEKLPPLRFRKDRGGVRRGEEAGNYFRDNPGGVKAPARVRGDSFSKRQAGHIARLLRSKSCHREVIEKGGKGGVRHLVS